MDLNQIFWRLDKHASEFNFPVLDNANVLFGAARLTAFRDLRDWLVIFEILGFSTQRGEFVNDLYAYGSCVDLEGFVGEEILFTPTPELPIFDPETNECVADWKNWAITINNRTLRFSPTPDVYAEAGIRIERDQGRRTQFHAITHSFAQRRAVIPCPSKNLRTLSITTGVYLEVAHDDKRSGFQSSQLFCLHRPGASLPSLCALSCTRFVCFQQLAASFPKTPGVGVA